MALLEAILGPPARLAGRVTTGISPADGGLFFGQRQSSAGVRVTEEDALSLSGVFAACNVLSGIIGTLPLIVYKVVGNQRQADERSPAYQILHDQPNPEMTAAICRRTLEFHRLLWGNCYGEVVWAGNGRPAELWPVEPWRVRPKRDDAGLYFEIDGRRRLDPEDVVHVPLISLDGVSGRSFIDYALTSLGAGIAAQEFAARAFGNGSRPGGILKHPGTPPAEQRSAFRKAWEEQHQGPERSNRVAVVWGGWEYTTDGAFNPEQLQLLEQRRFSIEEVSRWLNIPPTLLFELGRATWGNSEQMNFQFVLYCINTILVLYEQEYGRKLLRPPDVYCKHNVRAFMRGDSAARSAFYRSLFEVGAFTINDILELEDMNPIGKDGDVRFVPTVLRTLKDATTLPEQPHPPPSGGTEPPPDQPPGKPPQPPMPMPPPARGAKPALAALLGDTLRRLARVEANALRRVRPERLFAVLDTLYSDHERTLAEALAPVWEAAELLGERPGQAPAEVARGWCAESRRAVEDLSGIARPADWPQALDTLLAGWGGRPAAAAFAALGDLP